MSNSILTKSVIIPLLWIMFPAVLGASPYPPEYDKDVNFYVGLYGGSANTTIEFEGDIGLLDDDNQSYTALAGFSLNPYVAVEGAYSDFGTPSSELFGESQNDAYSLNLLVKYPILDRIYPYIKIGYISWDTKDDDGTQIGGTDFTRGAGVVFKIVQDIEVDLRYDYYIFKINNGNVVADVDAEIEIETSSVGLRYIF